MISFSFRGKSLPGNNLSLLWAFSSHFGAYLKITQAKDRGSAARGSHHEANPKPPEAKKPQQKPTSTPFRIPMRTNQNLTRNARVKKETLRFSSFPNVTRIQCVTARVANCEFFVGEGTDRQRRAAPGIEPGTSRTRSENHATRPSSQLMVARTRTILSAELCSFLSLSPRASHLPWAFASLRTHLCSLRDVCSAWHFCTTQGLLRELNPGPLTPGARIMPLDQAAS